jgi:hypothetical protein
MHAVLSVHLRVMNLSLQFRSSQDEREDVIALPSDPLDLIKPASNEEYIGRIRKRLNEDAAAREEREKRRRKVLVDQLKAHEAQEVRTRTCILVAHRVSASNPLDNSYLHKFGFFFF